MTFSTNAPSDKEAKAGESEMVAVRPSSSLPFFLRSRLLEELCCRGALSPCPQVSGSATAILALLLRTEGEASRPRLRETLPQWLPYIEVPVLNNARHICI